MIANNYHIRLSESENSRFKNDISVKGGSYIFITPEERAWLTDRGTAIIEADILDRKSLYKHDKAKIAALLEMVIFHSHRDV